MALFVNFITFECLKGKRDTTVEEGLDENKSKILHKCLVKKISKTVDSNCLTCNYEDRITIEQTRHQMKKCVELSLIKEVHLGRPDGDNVK